MVITIIVGVIVLVVAIILLRPIISAISSLLFLAYVMYPRSGSSNSNIFLSFFNGLYNMFSQVLYALADALKALYDFAKSWSSYNSPSNETVNDLAAADEIHTPAQDNPVNHEIGDGDEPTDQDTNEARYGG